MIFTNFLQLEQCLIWWDIWDEFRKMQNFDGLGFIVLATQTGGHVRLHKTTKQSQNHKTKKCNLISSKKNYSHSTTPTWGSTATLVWRAKLPILTEKPFCGVASTGVRSKMLFQEISMRIDVHCVDLKLRGESRKNWINRFPTPWKESASSGRRTSKPDLWVRSWGHAWIGAEITLITSFIDNWLSN